MLCFMHACLLHDELQSFAAAAVITVRNVVLHAPLLFFLVSSSPAAHGDHLAGWPGVGQVGLLTNSALSPTYQNSKAVAAV